MKLAIVETVMHLNRALGQPDDLRSALYEAESLADVCAQAELPEAARESLSKILPELAEVAMGALEAAAKADRGVYVTWRAGLDQELNVRVPRAPGLPVCLEFVSGYTEDGIVRRPIGPEADEEAALG